MEKPPPDDLSWNWDKLIAYVDEELWGELDAGPMPEIPEDPNASPEAWRRLWRWADQAGKADEGREERRLKAARDAERRAQEERDRHEKDRGRFGG